MRKKQKHPRLPNGFGTIRYLGEKRSRPYQVRAAGNQEKPGEILAYVDDWYKGFALLTAYNAHTWHPGDDIDNSTIIEETSLDGLVRRLLDDYRHISGKRYQIARHTTLKDIVEAWYEDKYENEEKRVFSKATKSNVKKGITLLEPYFDRPFALLRLDDLQTMIDDIDKPSMQLLSLNVLHGAYKYALARDIVEKDYSINLKVDNFEHKNGVPFSEQEIKKLWKLRDNPYAEMLLIMIGSGFRMSAYKDLEVNLAEKYFKGGVKTAAGKGRIVPIHSFILPLVKKRIERYGELIPIESATNYGRNMSAWCRQRGMDHTPHHTRHTFSALCERYGVRENDRKRMLGHSFKDVTNEVYGHRELEDLRAEIEKIPLVTLCDR